MLRKSFQFCALLSFEMASAIELSQHDEADGKCVVSYQLGQLGSDSHAFPDNSKLTLAQTEAASESSLEQTSKKELKNLANKHARKARDLAAKAEKSAAEAAQSHDLAEEAADMCVDCAQIQKARSAAYDASKHAQDASGAAQKAASAAAKSTKAAEGCKMLAADKDSCDSGVRALE